MTILHNRRETGVVTWPSYKLLLMLTLVYAKFVLEETNNFFLEGVYFGKSQSCH